MNARKLAWTVLALLAGAAALSGFVDQSAEDYADRALKSALVTFAVARTLNGVISAAQGTEVAVEPGGVGVTLSVGEILDPINDLVEQFSSIMLIAASSLGLQKLLLLITGWWGLTVLLIVAASATLVILWLPSMSGRPFTGATLHFLLVLLFVRFAVPMLIVGTTWISDVFLAGERAAATAGLESTRSEIEELSDESQTVPEAEQSLMERLGTMIGESFESMRVSNRLTQLRESASNASGHIVSLIAIFVLQTIILPLVFLWLFIAAVKTIGTKVTGL